MFTNDQGQTFIHTLYPLKLETLTHFSHHQLEKGSGPQLLTETFTGMNYKYPAELGHKPPAAPADRVHYL